MCHTNLVTWVLPLEHVNVEERTNSKNLYSDHVHAIACMHPTHAIHNTCMYMPKQTTHNNPKSNCKTHWSCMFVLRHVSCDFTSSFEMRHVHPLTVFKPWLTQVLVLSQGIYIQPVDFCKDFSCIYAQNWFEYAYQQGTSPQFWIFSSRKCNTEINFKSHLSFYYGSFIQLLLNLLLYILL